MTDQTDNKEIIVVPIEGMPGSFRVVKQSYIPVSYNKQKQRYEYDINSNIKVLCYQ
jgi:hypothetical protein